MNLLPDWLLVSMTGAALCCIVLGKWRWAAWLGAPPIGRFILWPLAWHYITGLPPIFVALAVLLALPFIFFRLLHRLVRLAASEGAADHALGHYFGRLLVHTLGPQRRKRHNSSRR